MTTRIIIALHIGAFAMTSSVMDVARAEQAGISDARLESIYTAADVSIFKQRIARLSSELSLQRTALEGLAAEVFRAEPHLPFNDYLVRFEKAAPKLSEALRIFESIDTPNDPALLDLRARAVKAVNEGRLQEAQQLYASFNQGAVDAFAPAKNQFEAASLELASGFEAAGELAASRTDFDEAASQYGIAASFVPRRNPEIHARYQLARAQILWQFGEAKADHVRIREALRIVREEALSALPRSSKYFAFAQDEICIAELKLSRWDGEQALERGLLACHAALRSTHAQQEMEFRAQVMVNLANQLSQAKDWEAAARYFEDASDIYLAASNELRAAEVRANLSAALTYQARSTSDLDLAERARAEAERSLGVFDQRAEIDGASWAGAQINLGNALVLIGELKRDMPTLIAGQDAYFQAFAAFTHERTPGPWAMTNFNFARVSEVIGDLASSEGRLSVAQTAYENAVRANDNVMLVRTQAIDLSGWTEANESRERVLAKMGQLN